jgi:ATP-dependent Zn protease
MDEAKGWGLRVVRDLADYRAGRIAWDRMDTAALLHGAPGCGKTLFAEALAKSTGIPLIATSFSAWQSSGTGHLGDCLREMRAAFDKAKAAAPAILFIDELDAVGDRARADKGHDDYWRSVVTAFLELLDGIGGRAGVLVLGATNNPGALDPAILRSGRMNRLIEVRLPGTADIAKIIRYFLGDDLAGADLNPVARRATGASGADCKRFVRSAQQRARHAGRPVEMADLLDEIGGQDMPPQIEYRVAVHESGHAVAAHILRPGMLVGASIGQHAGSAVTEVRVETSRAAVQAELVGLLAGRAAEEVVLGDISGGCGGPEGSDLALATCLAVGLDTALGLGGSGLLWTGMPSPRTVSSLLACRPAFAARAAALLDAAYAEAVSLVRRHRDAVIAVASELQVRRALSGAEIGDLVSRHPPTIDCVGRMQ